MPRLIPEMANKESYTDILVKPLPKITSKLGPKPWEGGKRLYKINQIRVRAKEIKRSNFSLLEYLKKILTTELTTCSLSRFKMIEAYFVPLLSNI